MVVFAQKYGFNVLSSLRRESDEIMSPNTAVLFTWKLLHISLLNRMYCHIIQYTSRSSIDPSRYPDTMKCFIERHLLNPFTPSRSSHTQRCVPNHPKDTIFCTSSLCISHLFLLGVSVPPCWNGLSFLFDRMICHVPPTRILSFTADVAYRPSIKHVSRHLLRI